MSDHGKISTAFDAFMADSGANDKRDALVIYRAPRDGTLPPAPKDPTERLKYVKERADRQRTVFISFSDSYEFEALRRLVNKRLELTTSSVGFNVLPVAQVEVTSRMLPALAERPAVVAIMPNQRLHPIEPRVVGYKAASTAESKPALRSTAAGTAPTSAERSPEERRMTVFPLAWHRKRISSWPVYCSANPPFVR